MFVMPVVLFKFGEFVVFIMHDGYTGCRLFQYFEVDGSGSGLIEVEIAV